MYPEARTAVMISGEGLRNMDEAESCRLLNFFKGCC